MNRELYIHTLSQFRDECKRKHMDTETEAFNAAIQALSADGDCISRQGVLDWLKNEWDGMVTSVFDGIKALPSAQPEIIRCKDCVKREHCRTTNVWAIAPSDDWYCADAERITDG